MLLIPHVLIRILRLVNREHLLVDHRLDVIRLNGAVHILELQARPDKDATNGADIGEAVEIARLIALRATQEADDGNDAVDLDRLEGLEPSCVSYCCGNADPYRIVGSPTCFKVFGPPTSMMWVTPSLPGVRLLAVSPQFGFSL